MENMSGCKSPDLTVNHYEVIVSSVSRSTGIVLLGGSTVSWSFVGRIFTMFNDLCRYNAAPSFHIVCINTVLSMHQTPRVN